MKIFRTLVVVSVALAGGVAYAQDASCVLHIGGQEIDASKVEKVAPCPMTPTGSASGVCLTMKDGHARRRIMDSRKGDDVTGAVQEISERIQHCGG